jgi:hypothetical protein
VLKIRDLARKSRRSNKELKTKEISVKMDLTRGFIIKVAKKQTFMAIICCYGALFIAMVAVFIAMGRK